MRIQGFRPDPTPKGFTSLSAMLPEKTIGDRLADTIETIRVYMSRSPTPPRSDSASSTGTLSDRSVTPRSDGRVTPVFQATLGASGQMLHFPSIE